jgi:hypothetical protein
MMALHKSKLKRFYVKIPEGIVGLVQQFMHQMILKE